MNVNFDILISFRTPSGFKLCAQYFLGKDATFAQSVFDGLSGRNDTADNAVLHLDLVETRDDLPQSVKTLGCKLDELGANCEHITLELFRINAISSDQS